MSMKQYRVLRSSSIKRTSKDNLNERFKDFKRILKVNIPLQEKIDKLNLEMLRILRERAN